jgi:phenylacetyl-CoA:acceptor oxidoreductase
MLVAAYRKYSPEWASTVCDVPAATIRRIANEYLETPASAPPS